MRCMMCLYAPLRVVPHIHTRTSHTKHSKHFTVWTLDSLLQTAKQSTSWVIETC